MNIKIRFLENSNVLFEDLTLHTVNQYLVEFGEDNLYDSSMSDKAEDVDSDNEDGIRYCSNPCCSKKFPHEHVGREFDVSKLEY